MVLLSVKVCLSVPSAHHHHHKGKLPAHNCTLTQETEVVEVCTPTFSKDCEEVTIPAKKIVYKKECFRVKKTTCKEYVDKVENTICPFAYKEKSQDAEAVGAVAKYSVKCVDQMVTVCSPGYNYGVNCKEVKQQTCYNAPRLEPAARDEKVVSPQGDKVCEDKSIKLPRLSCKETASDVCIDVPNVEEYELDEKVCRTVLGEPQCEQVTLSLPQEGCSEMIYGYTHENPHHHHPHHL